MLARRIPTLLPELTRAEALETTKIYSAMGLAHGLIDVRPFRAPHHTISTAALIGGGSTPRPGEISLVHNGVLFLDEFSEFTRGVVEGLRQPLEDRQVSIDRIHGALRLPASFLLVAAANPCPCGWQGSGVRECVCSPGAIERYRLRLSGPLLDRIDLQVYVRPVPMRELRRAAEPGESSDRPSGWRAELDRWPVHHDHPAARAHWRCRVHPRARSTCSDRHGGPGLRDRAHREQYIEEVIENGIMKKVVKYRYFAHGEGRAIDLMIPVNPDADGKDNDNVSSPDHCQPASGSDDEVDADNAIRAGCPRRPR